MTRAAVKNQFDLFVNEVIDEAYSSLRPWGILGPRGLPGNRLLRFLLGPILRNELTHYRASYNNQYKLIMDFAEDIADGEADFDDYRDELLNFDYFYQNHEGPPSEREAMKLALEDRYLTMGRDMAPLVAADEEDFWDAMQQQYGKHRARRTIRHNFDYANILTEQSQHVALYAADPWLGLPFPVSYTGEVLEALDASEAALRSRLLGKIQRIY